MEDYARLSCLWDREEFAPDALALSHCQTIDGWIYVEGSSLLIFYLTQKAFRKQAAVEKEKLQIFRQTLREVR